jgi:hypothetical protein
MLISGPSSISLRFFFGFDLAFFFHFGPTEVLFSGLSLSVTEKE